MMINKIQGTGVSFGVLKKLDKETKAILAKSDDIRKAPEMLDELDKMSELRGIDVKLQAEQRSYVGYMGQPYPRYAFKITYNNPDTGKNELFESSYDDMQDDNALPNTVARAKESLRKLPVKKDIVNALALKELTTKRYW